MPSLKLKHLRLRSLASFVTSLIVLISLCLTISGPHIAYAADADSIAQKDHDHPRLLELINQPGNFEDSQLQTGPEIESYTPEFTGFDRSIIGRAGGDARELGNNAPGKDNINGGDIHYWTFTNKTLWGPLSPGTSGLPSPDLEQRDAGRIYLTDNLEHGHDVEELNKRQNNPPTRRTLYISLNTCNQPHPSNPDTKAGPPQLQLYISQSLKNQKPDKTTNDQAITVDGGFGGANVTATSDVWFSVLAPQSSDFDGVYSYELTASIDAPYASYYDFKKLSLIDSDINSALLSSSSMTNQNSTGDSFKHWRNGPPRLSIFVHNQEDPAILGLQKSVCGLKNYAQVQGNLIGKNATNVETSMTTTYEGTPVQRFYAKNLNGSSAYYAIMAIDGNSTLAGGGVVRGGGSVWSFINFTTKSENNCQILYKLPFCYQVAYAVPSNPNITDLSATYDDYAASLYQNFSKSLQQIPCNTSSTAKYSLAKGCDDCDHAYRQWLCAVTIPRCEDFSSQLPYLQPRSVGYPFLNNTNGTGPDFTQANMTRMATNSSRNPIIDSVIQAGPYKEVLPCMDLCYELVRSCPAAMTFQCPLKGHGLSSSYGLPINGFEGPTCNAPWPITSSALVSRFGGIHMTLVGAVIAAVLVS